MKKRLTGYTFSAAAKTVTHADFSDITLEGIQLIVNTTDQIIIYNFADTTKGGTLSTDTLTLEYDTTSMDDTDKLMILVDDAATTQAISASSLPLPTGAATSAKQDTQTTELTSIKTAVETIDNAISGSEMQVDVVAALPAGTNNIGDVDVLTLPGVAGDVAAGAADSGNPVKIGGKYSSTKPTLTNGQRGDAELTTRGALTTALYVADSATAIAAVVTNADAVAASSIASHLETMSRGSVYNGSTWDRQRGDTNGTYVGGNVAHDTADAGSPVKVGGRAASTLSDDTMVANGDRTDFVSDLDGTQLVRLNFPLGDLLTDATSNTDGASTASGVFTATASTRSVITAIHVFRTDAGTTPIYIDFRDGTGGSVLWRMAIPAGGGSILSDPTGIFRTTANTALAYDVSAATTTVYINVSGFKSKV